MRRLPVWLPLAAPALAAALALTVVEACSSSHGAGPSSDAAPDASLDDAAPSPAADGSTALDCAQDLASDGIWNHLQCTGLYADFAAKTVSADATPYAPALQLWSDGAQKQRWLYVPPGQKIDTSRVDDWVFPNGTKAWKEFKVDGKRIETRLYFKGADGKWRHTAYRWSDDERDAVRSDDGVIVPRAGVDVPYQIPSGVECNDCHGGRLDRLLGVEPVNLGLPEAQGITLASLVDAGLLSDPPPATTIAFPEDSSGKAAAALGWLHVSCGPCHNRSHDANAQNSNIRMLTLMSQLAGADAGADGGPVPVTSLDAYVTTVDHLSNVEMPDGGALFWQIKRGDPGASLVSYLSGRRVGPGGTPNEKQQMPPIVSRLVDDAGHQKLDEWITAMP